MEKRSAEEGSGLQGAEHAHRAARVHRTVPRVPVDAAVADVVTAFRQRLENLPHRTAPELVGKDLDAIRAILKQEVHGALAEMEREFSKLIEQLGEIE